jgi:hypothetical protein
LEHLATKSYLPGIERIIASEKSIRRHFRLKVLGNDFLRQKEKPIKYKFYRAMSAASIVMFASAISAQQATRFAEIDTDGTVDISYEEAEAVFGRRGAEGLFRNDADGDGFLTVGELIEGGSAVEDDGNVVEKNDNVVEDAAVEYEDIDRGNDPDGFDEDNPGQGRNNENREVGGGNGNAGGKGGSSSGKGNK